ncbi:hypothetical protein [Corallococcus exercitus]|nr:hypothetical protein [Corallococcus exercitus]
MPNSRVRTGSPSFFPAGPADESQGLYGRLHVATTGATLVPFRPTR